MAAEWYYLSSGRQAGPIEFESLAGMARSGSLSAGELVFGPGLTDWTRLSQVPALSGADGASIGHQTTESAGAVLGYRGVETGNANLSPVAAEMLRQTKPWVRLISVLMLILSGLILAGALIATLAGATRGSRGIFAGGFTAFMGLAYLGIGAVYLVPALLLGRYANRIAILMRTNRMSDLEQALGAQKSFWKFVGISVLVVLCIYAILLLALVSRLVR